LRNTSKTLDEESNVQATMHNSEQPTAKLSLNKEELAKDVLLRSYD